MDTDLSDHSGLEDLWADHPNPTVPALPVVVQFNVLEHLPSHGLPRFESLTMVGLDLEAVKEALGTGIVVAVTLGAHAALELVAGQQRLIQRRTILDAEIGVNYHALGHHAATQGHLQGIAHQVGGHPLAHCPADDLTPAHVTTACGDLLENGVLANPRSAQGTTVARAFLPRALGAAERLPDDTPWGVLPAPMQLHQHC